MTKKQTIAQYFARIDFVKFISTVATIVGLVENLFRFRPGSGPRKREKALKTLIRILDPKGDMPDLVMVILPTLVDLLGKNAGRVEVVAELVGVFRIVQDAVEATDGLLTDDAEVRAAVVDLLNGEIDIPHLNEKTEKAILGLMLDLVVDVAQRDQIGLPL